MKIIIKDLESTISTMEKLQVEKQLDNPEYWYVTGRLHHAEEVLRRYKKWLQKS